MPTEVVNTAVAANLGVGDHQPKVAARPNALALASAQPRDHADVDRARLGDLAQGFAGGTALSASWR
jgi:hypothetical protein